MKGSILPHLQFNGSFLHLENKVNGGEEFHLKIE